MYSALARPIEKSKNDSFFLKSKCRDGGNGLIA